VTFDRLTSKGTQVTFGKVHLRASFGPRCILFSDRLTDRQTDRQTDRRQDATMNGFSERDGPYKMKISTARRVCPENNWRTKWPKTWPRYLACWFSWTLSRSSSNGKVTDIPMSAMDARYAVTYTCWIVRWQHQTCTVTFSKRLITGCLSSLFCAKVVAVTPNKGFPVDILSHRLANTTSHRAIQALADILRSALYAFAVYTCMLS